MGEGSPLLLKNQAALSDYAVMYCSSSKMMRPLYYCG